MSKASTLSGNPLKGDKLSGIRSTLDNTGDISSS